MIQFTALNPRFDLFDLGFLPEFLSLSDPRPAREQINSNYAHGGGWFPMTGFKYSPTDHSLQYPGDPKMKPLAQAQLRDELILFYQSAWVAIVQPNGDYSVARID